MSFILEKVYWLVIMVTYSNLDRSLLQDIDIK